MVRDEATRPREADLVAGGRSTRAVAELGAIRSDQSAPSRHFEVRVERRAPAQLVGDERTRDRVVAHGLAPPPRALRTRTTELRDELRVAHRG